MRLLFFFIALSLPAQVMQQSFMSVAAPSLPATTLESSCSGSSGATSAVCSSPLTVTAGDTISCVGSAFGFDPIALHFDDPVNGGYDVINGIVHPNTANTWVATAVFINSAGGSITPQVDNYEGAANINVSCRAWKGTRTSLAVDGGAVNLTRSATASNPTSGTAAAPTNDGEVVVGTYVRSSTSSTSAGSGWTPSGTLTAIGSNYPLYTEYQIQTTATAANSPYTAGSTSFIDTQFAILNAANSAGYRPVTGMYAPAITKSNGASVTAADLGGATTTLRVFKDNTSPTWALTGTAATYSTAINPPTGSQRIMVQGVPHVLGDSGVAINFGSLTATDYLWQAKSFSTGQPVWVSAFVYVASSGIADGNLCDVLVPYGGIVDPLMNLQFQYTTVGGLKLILEASGGIGISGTLSGLSLDTWYWVQIHIAGVNEQFHQAVIWSNPGSGWAILGTLNDDELCFTAGATGGGSSGCTLPTPPASTTGTASSGSTSLTVTSGAGILAGQEVRATSGIPYITTVASVSGTAVTLSQPTSGAVSGTVKFYTANPRLVSATNGTVSAGGTALTIVAPGTGTIAGGQSVAGPGITPGTLVDDITGTAVTLSKPTQSALTNGGVAFWSIPSTKLGVDVGKFSSCSMTNSIYVGSIFFDPYGTWKSFVP